MKYTFHIVDVFSSKPFGGNQLAVLPDAAGISTEGMQKIAREFNFGETTFVLPKRILQTRVGCASSHPGRSLNLRGNPRWASKKIPRRGAPVPPSSRHASTFGRSPPPDPGPKPPSDPPSSERWLPPSASLLPRPRCFGFAHVWEQWWRAPTYRSGMNKAGICSCIIMKLSENQI